MSVETSLSTSFLTIDVRMSSLVERYCMPSRLPYRSVPPTLYTFASLSLKPPPFVPLCYSLVAAALPSCLSAVPAARPLRPSFGRAAVLR